MSWLKYALSVSVFAAIAARDVFAQGHDAGTETTKAAEGVLYKKSLGRNHAIVIFGGPRRPGTDLAAFNNPYPEGNPIKSLFPVRVELRPGRGGRVALAGRLVVEFERQHGFEVLDVLADDRRIVICSAECASITIWAVTPRSLDGSRVTVLSQRDWTGSAAFLSIDHTSVAAKLRRRAGGLIEVFVDDLRPYFRRHTIFVECKGEWKFAPVRSDTGTDARPRSTGGKGH